MNEYKFFVDNGPKAGGICAQLPNGNPPSTFQFLAALPRRRTIQQIFALEPGKFNKTATQSSTHSSGAVASRAVDGNTLAIVLVAGKDKILIRVPFRQRGRTGTPFPVASCLGCGSPMGVIASVDAAYDLVKAIPITTAEPVLAVAPTLKSSVLDYLPICGSVRHFLFNYTTHNFEGALLSFGHLAVELSPLGMIGRGKAISLGIEYGPDAALRGTVLARQLGAEGEIAVRALYDIGKRVPSG